MISLRIPILLMASGLIVTVPAIAWSAAKPVERKVDPEVAKKKQEEAKAAAEKAAAEKLAAEKAAAEKAAAEKVAAEAKAAEDAKAAEEKKKKEEAEAAAAAAKAAEPPKGIPTYAYTLAPDSEPENVKLMQASLAKGVAATDKLHLVQADISSLPAELQASLNEGCRVSACRTAFLAALKVPQALIVEMNTSGSSMTFTLFSSSGDTLGRSNGSCIGCLEDEKKRDLVLGEMVQDLFLKTEAKTLAEANAEAAVTVESATQAAKLPAGEKGPLARGKQKRRAPKVRTNYAVKWVPSVWTYAGVGTLAATGGGLLIAASSAHNTYIRAINEGRGPGEIDGIASAGQAREMLGYTSMVLSAGVVVASYMLEQKEVRQ